MLRAKKVAVATSVLNVDRNPGDIDFMQYGIQVGVGLFGRAELFVLGVPVLRTNSVNQDPTGYPVPPLDLFIDIYPTRAMRPTPYFLFVQETPFKSYYLSGVTIDPPGHGAFGTASGGVTVGTKINLLSEDRGDAIGVGVRGYLDIPTEPSGYNVQDWRHATGTPNVFNIGVDALFAKRVGHLEFVANAGLKHVGDPNEGLRVQFVDSSKWGTPNFLVGAPVATKLDLHDQLIVNAGTTLQAFKVYRLPFWFLGEFGYTRYVGSGTAVERLVHPVEMRLGLQAYVPKANRVSIGVAFQLLLNKAGNGTTRRSQFHTPDGRGDINFTDQVDPELAGQVQELFAEQGATFRDRSSKVFATDNPQFDQWRNIPTSDQPVVALGKGNILAFITWHIN